MLAIIGCGNPTRTDDGVGVAVVQRLLARLDGAVPDGVAIYDAGTDGMGVMFRARGASELIIVDAASSGSEPGAVFEVPGEVLASPPPPGGGLHEFRWNHALYAGRRIYRDEFPGAVTVLLVEAASLDFGTALTDTVQRAADAVVERLAARIDAVT